MKIEIVPIKALKDNYIWTIINHQHDVLVVDPGEAEPVLAYLKQSDFQIKGILITHHHWDHTAGIRRLIEQNSTIPVFGHIESPCSELTHRVAEGDYINLNGIFPNYQVMAIPGHTLDHLAYYADGSLFCGDTLFAGGCGRLFEGKARQLYQSLQKIAALSEQTHIYCAHEYTLNNLNFAQIIEPQNPMIAKRLKKIMALRDQGLPSLPSLLLEEKQTNPFLRCDLPEVAQQVSHHYQRLLEKPIDVFTALRKWKDHF